MDNKARGKSKPKVTQRPPPARSSKQIIDQQIAQAKKSPIMSTAGSKVLSKMNKEHKIQDTIDKYSKVKRE